MRVVCLGLSSQLGAAPASYGLQIALAIDPLMTDASSRDQIRGVEDMYSVCFTSTPLQRLRRPKAASRADGKPLCSQL